MRRLILPILVLLLATPAHAEIGVCYTDPIVHLTDGQVVSLSARIQSANVSHVSYVLHIPSGGSVRSLTEKPLDSVTVIADGGYSASVTVTSPEAPVTATLRVPGVGSDSESGTTAQSLSLSL